MAMKINNAGEGGETHQQAGVDAPLLTTNHGVAISDNQNSLKSGTRGPTLLEDFVLREKIFHFDHERIPERIVHARGSGAHGVFEATDDISDLSKATVFNKGEKTEVFVRFSTVAGGAGSRGQTRRTPRLRLPPRLAARPPRCRSPDAPPRRARA